MKEKTKIVSCRAPISVCELIEKKCASKNTSKQQYFLGLILEDIKKDQNLINKSVNNPGDLGKNNDRLVMIHEYLDQRKMPL